MCAGVEEDGRLHLQHAAEDCQAPGGDTGPQESEPPARGQPPYSSVYTVSLFSLQAFYWPQELEPPARGQPPYSSVYISFLFARILLASRVRTSS